MTGVSVNDVVTERLVLRRFAPTDEDALHRQWNDPDVGRYLFDGEPVSRQMVRAQIEASDRAFATIGCGFFTLALAEAPTTPIGFAGLRAYGERGDVEVLYALLPAHWGRGLATEAARAVLRIGFENCALDEIHAGADVPNAASFRVMERLGMTPLGDEGGGRVRYCRLTRAAFFAGPAPGPSLRG